MKQILAPYSETIYCVMRAVLGFLFVCHGLQKTFGALGGAVQAPLSLGGIAGFIELVGGALIMVGLLTSYAAFLSSGLMAVAYFIGHFPMGGLPIQNQGELAVIYAFVFLYIAAHGGGRYSIDAILVRSGAPSVSAAR